ncbi:MAG: hypothetical protein P8100_08005 [bacterium]|jgi:hypothetical protein
MSFPYPSLVKYFLIAFLVIYVLPVSGKSGGFTLERDQIASSSGYIKLSWESDKDSLFILQKSDSPDFRDAEVIYSGPDKASFISGLENGRYYFRIRPADKSWSDTVLVEVKHQSLQLAFTLFGLGAIVFLLTVFVVADGVRKTSKETY